MSFGRLVSILALAVMAPAFTASADEATKVVITLKDHKFSPAEPTAPAGKPFVIELVNQDPTPAELESKPLRIEKVVPGGKTITVNVLPQKPGRYLFVDEYNESTTQGFLVVQ